jgi:hypothetical protein
MTNDDLQKLKTAILAETDAEFVAARDSGNNSQMLAWFNAAATPDFIVWQKRVLREELEEDDSFNWTVVDNLSTGSKYRIWEWMFGSKGYINPSKANIRAGIAACWVGNAQLLAVQAMVLAKCKRAATRAEKLFATGTGSTGSPAVMGFEGALSIDDIRAAVALG